MTLKIIPIYIQNEIIEKDKLVDYVLKSKEKIQEGDILVFSQKVVSKQEGRVISLSSVIPSQLALGISSEYEKDPKLVEIILSESKRIIRMENGIIIVETKTGLICANAGVDESNLHEGYATLLPENPDQSANRLQKEILEKTGKKFPIIISDTFGRAFRKGQTDCAIGLAGISATKDYRGKIDRFGKTLRVTEIAIADELCSAAELVMGKTKNCPVAIIRNFSFEPSKGTMQSLIRPKEEDLFR